MFCLHAASPVSDNKKAPIPAHILPLPQRQPYHPTSSWQSQLLWGSGDSAYFQYSIREVEEVFHWRNNFFQIPLGNVGKPFVAELSSLYKTFVSGSILESIALMATIVLPILLLLRPHKKSKAKGNVRYLDRWLVIWKDGDLQALIREGRAIQHRLPHLSRKYTTS